LARGKAQKKNGNKKNIQKQKLIQDSVLCFLNFLLRFFATSSVSVFVFCVFEISCCDFLAREVKRKKK